MKKPYIALVAVLFLVVHYASAQQIGYKEITDKRIEYIAQRLELTSQEAEKFWPLFREFHAEREKLGKAGRADDKKSVPQLSSEKDFENAINQMLDSKIQQTLLMKKYNVIDFALRKISEHISSALSEMKILGWGESEALVDFVNLLLKSNWSVEFINRQS